MTIERIAVIGAGQMGTGIAQVAAQAGFTVRLLDVDPALAQAAVQRISAALSGQVKKGKLEERVQVETMTRISPISRFADLADAQVVIEAAVEDASIKAEIFKQAEAVTNPDVILASNTSSIPITKLAARTKNPERFIGVHFMNPPPLMRLVEIIRGLQTSDETAATVRAIT